MELIIPTRIMMNLSIIKDFMVIVPLTVGTICSVVAQDKQTKKDLGFIDGNEVNYSSDLTSGVIFPLGNVTVTITLTNIPPPRKGLVN